MIRLAISSAFDGHLLVYGSASFLADSSQSWQRRGGSEDASRSAYQSICLYGAGRACKCQLCYLQVSLRKLRPFIEFSKRAANEFCAVLMASLVEHYGDDLNPVESAAVLDCFDLCHLTMQMK